MSTNETNRSRGRAAASRVVLALVVVAATAAGSWPATASAAAGTGTGAAGTRTVTWRGVSVEVPQSWPVRTVAGRPGCVRLDRTAVYLGDPSRSTCPPHLVGHAPAVHLTTGSLQGISSPDRVVTAAGSPVGVLVSAGPDPALARAIAASVTYDDATPKVTAPKVTAAATAPGGSRATLSRGSARVSPAALRAARTPVRLSDTTYTGLGFDACTAQPLTTMATWYAASPYKASNMYIGGASRGCAQPNLNADWVAQTIAMGWTLIPTYVGLQAPCVNSTTIRARVDPAQAAAQGVAAADDAVAQMLALGLGVGNPIYFDMEGFPLADPACSAAVLTFLDTWTERLHERGYVSGVYGSAESTIKVMVDSLPNPAFTQPDQLWIARWCKANDPACYTGTDDPVVPTDRWNNHQRIRQYRGGHLETWGGVTVNIDNNTVDAAVSPSQLAAEGAFVQVTGRPEIYRIAGGAPIVVSDFAAVGGPGPVQALSQSQFDSLPERPATGTFLQSGATGRVWRVVNGVATYVPSWTPYGGPQPSIVVDQAALDNAGSGGVWNLLTSGAPAPRTVGPVTLGTLLAKTRFTWFGGYSSSAVATYDVRWRRAGWDGGFGPWTYPKSWARTAVSDVPLGLPAGVTACVSVRARNRAGQVSGWTAPRCQSRALDDRRLAASAGWARKRAATFVNGSALSTTTRGATVSRSGAKVRRVGVVATRCPSCGTVAVLIDGKRVGKVNLAAPGRQRRQVLMLAPFARQRGTVTVKVISSGRLVQVDGLVISRA